MDLNYLYHRRGQSLLMAERAACEPSRAAHLNLGLAYVARISELRRHRSAPLFAPEPSLIAPRAPQGHNA